MLNSALKRGVITIIFGNKDYFRMGEALGWSLKRFCPNLPSAVVTDQIDGPLAEVFDHVIPLNPEYGLDVVQKLFLDRYTPFEATLFIDCDSLVFGPLDYVFDGLAGGATIIPDQLYFHSVDHPKPGIDFSLLESRTGIKEIPGFNGGVYYIENGTASERIFIESRDILRKYTEYGIGGFRSGPNDEIVLAISMALVGYTCAQISKQVMRETYGLDGRIEIDSIKGRAELCCYGINYSPTIVHFCSGWRQLSEYKLEILKLKLLHSGRKLALPATQALNWSYPKWKAICARVKLMWGRVPRPIRLIYHGVVSRARRLLS